MRLFLYGTLQPLSATAMARWLAPRIATMQLATTHGRLAAIGGPSGWYPALVAPGTVAISTGRICHGTLVTLRLTRCERVRLDRYEGRDYRLRAIAVQVERARTVAAGAYLWSGALPRGALPIPGGDFLAWLERTDRRSFAVQGSGR